MPFRQTLRLRQGQVEIVAGPPARAVTLLIWVDANQPVVRVEAEGKKQAAILEAEGEKEAAFREAEARERLAEAEAKATHMVSQAIAKGDVNAINYFVAQKYTEALQNSAAAPNQKVVLMPLEASSLIGSIGGIAEIAKETLRRNQKEDA